MSYPSYPEYQKSKVRWLGDVPSHWSIFSLKRAVNGCINGVWGDEPDGTSDVVVLRVADFNRAALRVGTEKLTPRSVSERDKQNRLVRSGDLLIEKSGGGDKTLVGCVVLFDLGFEAVTSNFVGKMRPLKGFDANFLCYAFNSLYQQRVNYPAIKQTTGIQNLDVEAYLQERFCFPPKSEQTQIARFLDHQTARIDALIAEQQRLIELLKEKRQAVISHAVTKGLDPDVAMKNSGVEWLGKVPSHWEVRKLSTLTDKITNGYVGPTRDLFVDDGIPYLQSLHIKNNQIIFSPEYYVPKSWSDEHSKSILKPDDLLIVQTGDIGQIAVVPDDFPEANCHALIVTSTIKQSLSGSWLAWVLLSDYGYNSLMSIKTGALHPHLNCGYVKDIYVPVPPFKEQAEIQNHLGSEEQGHQELLAEARSVIGLLKERRSALISAAVTGKVDVRDWESPVSETFPQPTASEEAPARA